MDRTPYEHLPFDMFANRFSESDAHAEAIPSKDIGGGGGGIAELERVFGSNIDQRPNHPLHGGSKFGNKLNTTIHEISDCPSEDNSDVDCEQL